MSTITTQKVIFLRLSFISVIMTAVLLTACFDDIFQESYVGSKNAVAVHAHEQNLRLMQVRTTAANKMTLFQTMLTQVQQSEGDMTTSLPLVRALAYDKVQQFHQAVTDWGNSHLYVDNYNGKSYPLDYEYAALPGDYGVGADLDDALQTAETLSDYQNIIALVQNDQEMLSALEDDAQDLTPWNQPHATDQHLMQYFQATRGLVIVVSFYEQALRLYQDGQLVEAYQVVTGLYERPSPPGYWQINSHSAQSLFTSFEEPNSPLYFPPTQVYWAMGFADPSLGYFIHASPWRTYYGQGKNFPHNDPHNDNTESRNGSHGCVNLPLDQAQELYQQVSNGTAVILY